MTKNISAYILSLVVLLALFLYGCGSHDGSVRVNPMGDRNITSREGVIDGQGRLQTLTFSSGAKIEALEENTLTPGIKVAVTEESLASSSVNRGYFNNYTPTYIYIYRITAFETQTNPASSKAYVTTTEKPFKITLPSIQASQGLNFIGIKESDSDPWRYFSLSDDSEILVNLAGVRLAGANTKDYSVSLFRLGIQVAFLCFDDNEKSKLPECIVTSLIASSTPSIAVKNGKYCEDLKIRGILNGRNLDSINPTDLRARITYRSSQAYEADIKVNGVNVMQKNKADKTVPGSSYYHTFEVESITGYNLSGSNGDFSFILNLNGVETSSFPTAFLIEFYNKITNDKIFPYIYSEFYSIQEAEPEPEPDVKTEEYTIDYFLDGGSVAVDNPKGYNTASETFVLTNPTKAGYEFIGWGGTGLSGNNNLTVSIEQGSTGNKEFKAYYSPIVYNISYQLDGGQTTNDNPTIYDVTSDTIILNNPTKDGLSFVGWTGSNGNTPQTTVIIEQGSTGNKTYVANYTSANYVITYNLDGGTVTPPNPTGYNTASETFILTNPTKNGYEFLGWGGTGLSGNNNLNVSIGQGSAEDKEFTAYYSPIVYSISYQLDGGHTTSDNPTSYDVTSATIKLNNPTREGYTFTGWTGNGIATPDTFAIIEKGSYGNKSFTANWSVNSYNVMLVKGTGIATVTGDGPHQFGSTVTASYTLIDGYEFDSWAGNYTESTFVMPANDVMMQANAKLKTYSIECELDGGNTAVPNQTSYNTSYADITLINPTKNGYDFIGWTGSNGDIPEEIVTILHGSCGNKSYTANYAPTNYHITYHLDGGQTTVDNPEVYDITSTTITLNNPTKDDVVFIGWTGSNGDMPQTEVTIETGSTGDKEFTANYMAAQYIISYYLSGGTNAPENPYGYNFASETFTLSAPSKFGYAFVGWTGSNGDVPELTVSITQGSSENKVFMANWSPIGNIITYNLNNGINHPANPHGYNVASETFSLYEPTRAGYAFVGWTEGVATFPQMIVEIPQGSTDDKTFTAHWVECITFTLPGGVPIIMHKCPAGNFTMGSPDEELGREHDDNSTRESPQHQVTITQDYYMGKFEVTQEQYMAVMETNPASFSEYADSNSRPVERVTWSDANAFCASLTNYLSAQLPVGMEFRLPTEAQWEYACRAGTTSSLNNGTNITVSSGNCSNLNLLAWYASISGSQTHAVGQKQPNAWGLYDMHGNVWEWCKDRYDKNYYQTCGNCSDPENSSSGSHRVLRGGAWGGYPRGCRSANRGNNDPSSSAFNIGFRAALVSAP